MREKLTKQDIQKIKDEIEHRRLVVRKEAIEAVKEARAHGDLSENFEYHAAKKDKNQNESRIRYLERMLKTAVVVEDKSGEDEVGMDNTVTVHFEEDNEDETYRIVTSIRGNSLGGMISIESPIGKALMGHKVGDRVKVQVNDQISYYVTVKSITKTSDESEDTIRRF
ncbi:MAG: transcription elongation factor GreA [Hespellia sp.]|nr:transcription elongation factor GreA [Hespellia sp.]